MHARAKSEREAQLPARRRTHARWRPCMTHWRLASGVLPVQFGNIVLGGKDAHRDENVGQLKVHSEGFGWKSRKAGNVVVISKRKLSSCRRCVVPPTTSCVEGISLKQTVFRITHGRMINLEIITTASFSPFLDPQAWPRLAPSASVRLDPLWLHIRI